MPKQKKINQEIFDEEYVFPVFSDDKKRNVKANVFNKHGKKEKARLSSYILDLRKPINSAPPQVEQFLCSTPSDNYFHNQIESELNPETLKALGIQSAPQHKVDFELPDDPGPINKKIEYNKPVKFKIKSKVKLDFGQDFVEPEIPIVKQTPKAVKVVSKPVHYVWSVIVAPFRLLDFLVDRILKLIWWTVKSLLLGVYNLLKSIALKIKILFSSPRTVVTEIQVSENTFLSRINYKPVVSFLIVCLLIILPIGILNWQQKTNAIKGQVLGRSMAGFEELKNAANASQNFDFSQAGQAFGKAYFNFKIAENYLNNLDIFSSQLINVIPQTSQANDLLLIGQLSARLGEDLAILGERLQSFQNSGPMNVDAVGEDLKLTERLELIDETVQDIEPNFLELIDQVDELDVKNLSSVLDADQLNKLILFQQSLPVLKTNFDKLKVLNDFMLEFLGTSGKKKYLVIFQNNSELRPTGGFMGSFALVELKDGEIVNLEVPGGGFYDLKAATQVVTEAPKPFHLFSPYWQIWNANWFPDWPASAEKISWFYEKTLNGMTVDGVISITPNVIEDFLDITGEISMPEYDKTITSENFVREIQMAVEIEYDKEENKPKQIIADILPKILSSLFNLETQNAPEVVKLLSDNLNSKNILFWFRDDELEKVVNNFDWSGEIKSVPGDFLMVVHTNIGGGKTDRVVKNKIEHLVEINNQGEIFDTVTLTKNHTGQVGDIFEDQNNVDYVRFYVPLGSQLINATGFDVLPGGLFKIVSKSEESIGDPHLEKYEKNPILDERFNMRITEEFGKTVFGNWLQIKTGEQVIATIKYKLPFKLEKENQTWIRAALNFIKPAEEKIQSYNLTVQKQAGLSATEFSSQFNLPSAWQIENVLGLESEIGDFDNQIIYESNLEKDGFYEVKLK